MVARRSLDETRTLILDAGMELLSEAGYSLQGTDVLLIDACRRAGLSTAGSGYKIWPTQRDFRVDLMRHVLYVANTTLLNTDRMVEAIGRAGEDPSLSTLIRVAATDNAEATIGAPEYFRNHAVWLAAKSDAELRERFVEAQRVQLGMLAELYEGLLAIYDREMVPPFTVDIMTLAIASEVDGLASWCSYVDDVGVGDIVRPTGPDGGDEQWHLLGCVVEAIVEAFTRPRTPVPESETDPQKKL